MDHVVMLRSRHSTMFAPLEHLEKGIDSRTRSAIKRCVRIYARIACVKRSYESAFALYFGPGLEPRDMHGSIARFAVHTWHHMVESRCACSRTPITGDRVTQRRTTKTAQLAVIDHLARSLSLSLIRVVVARYL